MHYPAGWDQKGGKAMRQAGWRALEAAVKAGKAKSIGISHFCRQHVEDILEIATIKPAINQVEYHIGARYITSTPRPRLRAGERRLAVLLDDHALPNVGYPTTIRTS